MNHHGYAIGNQLEIIEAIEAIKGNMPEDIEKIVYALGEQLLLMTRKADNEEMAHHLIKEVIESGKAFNTFIQLVKKQGGDISYIEDTSKFQNAKHIIKILAKTSGNISEVNAEKIGRASSQLGAGRKKKDDIIDYQAGIILTKKVGDRVEEGEIIAYLHTNREDYDDAIKTVESAICICNENVNRPEVILRKII